MPAPSAHRVGFRACAEPAIGSVRGISRMISERGHDNRTLDPCGWDDCHVMADPWPWSRWFTRSISAPQVTQTWMVGLSCTAARVDAPGNDRHPCTLTAADAARRYRAPISPGSAGYRAVDALPVGCGLQGVSRLGGSGGGRAEAVLALRGLFRDIEHGPDL